MMNVVVCNCMFWCIVDRNARNWQIVLDHFVSVRGGMYVSTFSKKHTNHVDISVTQAARFVVCSFVQKIGDRKDPSTSQFRIVSSKMDQMHNILMQYIHFNNNL